jgi:hypothetical protein
MDLNPFEMNIAPHLLKFQHFMVLVGSLPYSQNPTRGPWINEVQNLSACFFKILFLILISQLSLHFLTGLLLSGFPTKTLYAFLSHMWRAACHAHLILLDLIIIIISGKEYTVNREENKWHFLANIRCYCKISNFVRIRPVVSKIDMHTDRYDFIVSISCILWRKRTQSVSMLAVFLQVLRLSQRRDVTSCGLVHWPWSCRSRRCHCSQDRRVEMRLHGVRFHKAVIFIISSVPAYKLISRLLTH